MSPGRAADEVVVFQEDGPISYFPDQDASDGGIAISGNSMSYSGPLMKQPANDGPTRRWWTSASQLTTRSGPIPAAP